MRAWYNIVGCLFKIRISCKYTYYMLIYSSIISYHDNNSYNDYNNYCNNIGYNNNMIIIVITITSI